EADFAGMVDKKYNSVLRTRALQERSQGDRSQNKTESRREPRVRSKRKNYEDERQLYHAEARRTRS
ncbi:MAG: hypothetical protein ACYC4Q_03990, partial [Victivallaceae bacterium]